MSNRPHARPSRYARSELVQYALAASAFSGCDCDPEVRRIWHTGNIRRISVRHDSWCALLAGPGVTFIVLPNQRSHG